MSSQDSEGEIYVADYIADPKVYGDLEHYGWTTEEEEDYDPKGKEEVIWEGHEASTRVEGAPTLTGRAPLSRRHLVCLPDSVFMLVEGVLD